MRSRRILRVLSLALVVSAVSAPVARAASHVEFINGATCLPYPQQSSVGSPYQHWLYMFGQTAFCHLTMTDEWPLASLFVVMINLTANAGTTTARLCVHAGGLSVACGPPTAVTGSGPNFAFVMQPTVTLPDATGAFVQLTTPSGTVTLIHQIIPIWFK